jgi:ribosomal protein S1
MTNTLRARCGLSLREAKEATDRVLKRDPVEVHAPDPELASILAEELLGLGACAVSVTHWEKFKREHPPRSAVTGTVVHVAQYGAYVDLGVPFDACLLVPYLAPVGKHPKRYPEDYPKCGEKLAALIRHYGDQLAPNGAGVIALTQDPDAVWTTDPNEKHPSRS